jgi:hypothetical protein
MPGKLATGIGILTIVCAVFGLLYNAQSLVACQIGGFADLVMESRMTWFYPAFYAMSAICIVCYAVLLWTGYRLARRQFSASSVLIRAWLFEIGYFLVVGAAWRIPDDVGESIAAASGVANGGMMAQLIILLPVWGPLAVFWIKRQPTPFIDSAPRLP